MKNMKYGTLLLCNLLFNSFASASIYEKLEVDQAKNPVLMNHKDATYFCSLKGLRLPTARELANDAISSGMVVLDTQYPNLSIYSPEVATEIDRNFYGEGMFQYISKSVENGYGVDFYYHTHNYDYKNKPIVSIWSSSICPSGHVQCENPELRAFAFHVGTGFITAPSYGNAAVVCIK